MINSVTLSGNLGRDPELVQTNKGKVCKFSIAHNQGKDKEPMWVDVAVWDKSAERCNSSLKKGSRVTINGKLQLNHYTNKQGEKKQSTSITAWQVHFEDKKSESKPSEKNIMNQDYTLKTDSTFTSDDIPF